VPRLLNEGPQPAIVGVFLIAIECFKRLILLSFDKNLVDCRDLSILHFAAAGENFVAAQLVPREIDFDLGGGEHLMKLMR
jgi:hypothetical protein